MKRIIISTLLYFVIAGFSHAQNTDYKEISGTVIDAETKKPLPISNVYVKDAGLGTVTNNSGEFTLKVPFRLKGSKLVASSIGYASYEKLISEITESDLVIKLETTTVIMDEVVIQDVEVILKEAMKRKSQNYPDKYQVMTSFYREVVKKNRSYIDVAQGIINISKGAYVSNDLDQLSIVKGSRSKNYQKEDTLAFKVMGGPNTMLLLDIVKNPGSVLNQDLFDDYKYKLEDIKMIDGHRNYAISFRPITNNSSPRYTGIVYIEVKSYAITGLSFEYDDENLKLASQELVRKKPTFVKVTPKIVKYDVKYRQTNGLWYLDYVRNEIEMKCNWKKKLFNSTFNSVSEMVVTQNNSTENVVFTKQNTTKSGDIFTDKVSAFYDKGFWENYSIIQPEEDLRKALVKINSKTK